MLSSSYSLVLISRSIISSISCLASIIRYLLSEMNLKYRLVDVGAIFGISSVAEA